MTDGAGGLGGSQVVADAGRVEESRREVLAGLRRPDKRISSKFHYDERGSELFEQITRLDEYYLTRSERALLVEWMPTWVRDLRPATLVELGAGSADKSRIVLNAMVEHGSGVVYVPIDVSADFLNDTARQLHEEYPALAIVPKVADIMEPIGLPAELPGPRWLAFLGSTLGNFESSESVQLLERVAAGMGSQDRFLLGIDLRSGPLKSVERIELAYDDPPGITSAFSLNVLNVLNHEVGSDFDVESFRHRSFYNVEEGRIETFLDSIREQVVRFPDGEEVRFAEGEAMRTEISTKYDRATIDDLFDRAGLVVDQWVEDERGYYALVLGAR